jgi:hypothetical protein
MRRAGARVFQYPIYTPVVGVESWATLHRAAKSIILEGFSGGTRSISAGFCIRCLIRRKDIMRRAGPMGRRRRRWANFISFRWRPNHGRGGKLTPFEGHLKP